MDSQVVLASLAALLALGVGAQWLGWRTGVPGLLFLLAAGFVVGPLTGLLDPDLFLGDLVSPLVDLSVALVLYEGGLRLQWADVQPVRWVVNRLVLLGLPLTWMVATAGGAALLGLDPDLALLLGAVLTVSGPTVVGPLLEAVRPSERVRSVLEWEGALIDPLGATLGVLVYTAVFTHHLQGSPLGGPLRFVEILAVGILAGMVGAQVLVGVMKRLWLPDSLHNGVTLALVLSVFAACEQICSESGLFAVTLMGMLLGNQKHVEVRHLADFSATIRVLVVGCLFVGLAAREPLAALLNELRWETAVFVGILVLGVRPLVVALATEGSLLPPRERVFVGAMFPRGIVAAAAASSFALRLDAAGHTGADRLIPIVFLVIVATVALYGLGCIPLGRWLGLRQPVSQGCLVVSASEVAVRLAEALQRAGVKVLLLDLDPDRLEAARAAGLPVHSARSLPEADPDAEALRGLGRVLGLGRFPELNALMLTRYAGLFPRSERFLLPDRGASARPGQTLFAKDATYEELERRLAGGARVEIVREPGPTDLPLFVLGPGDRVQPVVAGRRPAVAPDQAVLALVG